MSRRVQVSQVRDGSGLDRTVAWSHLEDIYKDKMIYWMWVRKRKGSRFLGVPGGNIRQKLCSFTELETWEREVDVGSDTELMVGHVFEMFGHLRFCGDRGDIQDGVGCEGLEFERKV